MTRERMVEIISCLFILLFVYAAISKLLEYQKFAVQIGQSPMLTEYAYIIAWAVPGIEILISALLIFPKTRLIALFASFSLMIMFTCYIILASQFSDYVPCSCGGVIQNLTWTQHLVFNMIFIIAGLAAVLLHVAPGISSESSSNQAM